MTKPTIVAHVGDDGIDVYADQPDVSVILVYEDISDVDDDQLNMLADTFGGAYAVYIEHETARHDPAFVRRVLDAPSYLDEDREGTD